MASSRTVLGPARTLAARTAVVLAIVMAELARGDRCLGGLKGFYSFESADLGADTCGNFNLESAHGPRHTVRPVSIPDSFPH